MFTIVIPYYKNSLVVERCLQSITKQTFGDFEAILVDDCSQDNIDEIVDRYQDNRIRVIHQPVNKGVSVARNTGISNATREWICFLDSDDAWELDHLQVLHTLIEKYSGTKYFITSYKKIGDTIDIPVEKLPEKYDQDFLVGDLLGLVLMYGTLVHTNSICMHRSMFGTYGMFDEGSSIGEDIDMWYRCAMYETPVFTKKVTTQYYRDASYLTKKTNHTYAWKLIDRKNLIEDYRIPVERRDSLQVMLTRYQLSSCKHYIAEGRREDAQWLFNQIKDSIPQKLGRSQKQVRLLLSLPPFIGTIIASLVYRDKMRKAN